MNRATRALRPLDLPHDLTVVDALQRVLKLPAVASKRYLTNKVPGQMGVSDVVLELLSTPLHVPMWFLPLLLVPVPLV